MSGEIRVHVVDYGIDRNLMMRYTDPATGRQHARSTGTRKRRDAEKAAAVWEAELRAGQYKPDGRIPWQVFRQRYNEQHLARLKERSDIRATGVLSMFEQICHPATLSDVTPQMRSNYPTPLRKNGRAENTITTHTATIRAALQWAVDLGFLRELPNSRQVARSRRGKGKASPMKGRPLTDAEFRQFLDAVPSVVGPECAAGWVRYLRGLWTSGLRLEESLALSWNDPRELMVDLSGRRPVLRSRPSSRTS